MCGLHADGDGDKSIHIPYISESTEKTSGFELCLRKKVKKIFCHYWTNAFVDSFAKMKKFWGKGLDGTDLKNLLEYSNSKYLYFVTSRLWLKVIGMFRSNQIDAGLSWRRQQNTFPLKGKPF